MQETYCPFCRLVHNYFVEECCDCGSETVLRPDSSNGTDKTCPACMRTDNIEMA